MSAADGFGPAPQPRANPGAAERATGATGTWEAVGPLADLAPGSLRTFKKRGSQLVILRTAAGDVRALDNRCPHEGYPLAQGALNDCTLTCNWHNWKFDVRDGTCLLGGEDVRTYPVRVRDGRVEVDLADPPPALLVPRLRQSLEHALGDADTSRAIRDGARLLRAGYDPWTLLADLARYDARHAEYGSTHVLAVAADCGRLLDRYRGADAMYAIAPALDLCAETNARLPERPVPPALAGGGGDAIRAAVEAEDAVGAEGLLRGAFAAGVSRPEIESWLHTILADHFLDFGHPLIYLAKAGELLDRAGEDYARDIFPALLYGIVLGTREDRLPYLRGYFRRLEAMAPEFPRLHAAARPDAPFDPIPVRDAVLDGSAAAAIDAVWSVLERGVPGTAVARALVAAAAHRLFRFDLRWEEDPDVAEGWLSATHRLTFASAVRTAVERFRSPASLHVLFQAVAFIHSGRRMDAPPADRLAPGPAAARTPAVQQLSTAPRAGRDVVADAVAAVWARRCDEAVERARIALQDPEACARLQHALEDLCLQDRFVLPIFAAHAIKTTVAAFAEHAALAGHPDRDVPVLAAIRFLAAPVRERDLHATVRSSLRWVMEGKVPRKLTQ